jgi:ABC-2 type transport system ATP-binding protein
VLDDLRSAGVGVARVTSHRPTLDDVFLTLTAASRVLAPAAVPA